MSKEIGEIFNRKNPAFIAYLTAGYPRLQSTVDFMLSLEKGGADILELGVPFSDPIADGPTIQTSSYESLLNGTTLDNCLEYIKEARNRGLKTPVILMGYYNVFLNYGTTKLMDKLVQVGGNGFIIVDLPPLEAVGFTKLCHQHNLSYIPLITPTTGTSRLNELVKTADSFIYIVSVSGVTGARAELDLENLKQLVARVRTVTKFPLAVGFGISSQEQFDKVASVSDGVVIGSKIVQLMKTDSPKLVQDFAEMVVGGKTVKIVNGEYLGNPESKAIEVPKLEARFGEYGGQFAPEALVDCLDEIEKAFINLKNDSKFWEEFKSYYPYIGRPSSLHLAPRLTELCKGANIWLKREDLNHTGSHKINNALGQVLLALRLGKKRIIAETGAGQHGVATATVCAKFGLDCTIYMGAEDVRRQALNVFRIKLLGAKVVSVQSGSKTLKDAINEALRDWVTNVATTHYIIGSAIGPHPFPLMVREFQSVIGSETRAKFLQLRNKLPDAVVACVGGGSNAIGMFHPFVEDSDVKLIGVEAGGSGTDTKFHSATLRMGRPGVLHGTKTYLLQDDNGQIIETHSISAGLDYPGVGPEHAFLKDSKRVEYVVCNDKESLIGLRLMSQYEGIIPALETAHAIYAACELAKTMKPDQDVVICISGRGDKDVATVAESLPTFGPQIGW